MPVKIDGTDNSYVSISKNKIERLLATFLAGKGIETDEDFDDFVDTLTTAQSIYPAFRKLLKGLIQIDEV